MELYENTLPMEYRNVQDRKIQKKHKTPHGVIKVIIGMAVLIALMLAAIAYGIVMIMQEREQIKEIRNIQESLSAQLNDTECSSTSPAQKQDVRNVSHERVISAMNATRQQLREKLGQEYTDTSLARKRDARIVSLEQNLSTMNASLQQARQKLVQQEHSGTSLARKQNARSVSLEQNLSTMNASLQQARRKLVQQEYSGTSVARKQDARIVSLKQNLSTMNASLQQARQKLVQQEHSGTSLARNQNARSVSLEQNLNTMNATLEQARRKLGQVESDSDNLKKSLRAVACPIWYKDKCFLPIKTILNHTSASELCKKFGGGLANIYDRTHLTTIMKSIRFTKMNGLSAVNFHLGMKFVPSNGALTLSDGKPVTRLIWYTQYPKIESSRTSLALRVHQDESSPFQYLWNIEPQVRAFVLCELG